MALLFKASALWTNAFYKSKCPSVCPSFFSVRLFVRLSVCPSVYSFLRYRLNVFLPPLSKVGCPIFLEIQNPWGKVMKRSGLRFEHFFLKLSKSAAQKDFFAYFCLTKHGLKPCFRWIRDLWSKGVSLILAYL